MLSTFCFFTWVVRVCAGPLRGRNVNSCCLWFWQLVFGEFGGLLRDATSNLPSSPNPLSNRSVLHDGRKHKTVVSSQPNASPFNGDAQGGNGIERSLSRVVVPPSLPVSATTFPTALSVYIAQGHLRKDIRYPSCSPRQNRFHSKRKYTLTWSFLLAWSMPTKWCWVIHGRFTSERKAYTSHRHSSITRPLPAARALKHQAPCLIHARQAQNALTPWPVGSTRGRGNHMHDHSRFQGDIDWRHRRLSLSLSLSLSPSHNWHKSHSRTI